MPAKQLWLLSQDGKEHLVNIGLVLSFVIVAALKAVGHSDMSAHPAVQQFISKRQIHVVIVLEKFVVVDACHVKLTKLESGQEVAILRLSALVRNHVAELVAANQDQQEMIFFKTAALSD